MSSEGQQLGLEARQAAVSEAIRELWRPEAEAILNLVADGDRMVTVWAPSGSGKSRNLIPIIPMIQIVASERGYQPWAFNCQMLSSKKSEAVCNSFARKQLSAEMKNGLAVLDEPVFDESTIREVDTFFTERGYTGIIPIFRVQIPRHLELVETWERVGREKWKKFTRFSFEPKQLPRKLAESFLIDFYNVPREIVGYIIDNFPLYPRVLAQLSGEGTIEEVNRRWHDLTLRQRAGFGFTSEEAELVNKRLGL